MKKSLLSAFLGLVLLSCTATKGMLNEEKTLLDTYPIRKANEIER
ncbi:hypothetical protein [Streptobacillus felis]|nr:hypothetical protein [Streptobacillus felis]